jgi:hypothetical protein
MEQRLLDEIFSFTVEAAATPVSRKFDLDRNVKLVCGILLRSDKPNLLFYRGSQRIEISGDEIFPKDFESKILMSGMGVAPDQKYRSLGNGLWQAMAK